MHGTNDRVRVILGLDGEMVIFKGDPTTKTTTWEFDSTQEADEARFFRIEGVREK